MSFFFCECIFMWLFIYIYMLYKHLHYDSVELHNIAIFLGQKWSNDTILSSLTYNL